MTTRKIAAFVSGEETSCEMVAAGADTWVLVGAGVIRMLPTGVGNNRASKSPTANSVVSESDSLPNDGKWRRQ